MVDISIVNGIINQLITGGHHLVGMVRNWLCHIRSWSIRVSGCWDKGWFFKIIFGGTSKRPRSGFVSDRCKCFVDTARMKPQQRWDGYVLRIGHPSILGKPVYFERSCCSFGWYSSYPDGLRTRSLARGCGKSFWGVCCLGLQPWPFWSWSSWQLWCCSPIYLSRSLCWFIWRWWLWLGWTPIWDVWLMEGS